MIQSTAMTGNRGTTSNIAAIVLAAGGATRMGELKQLLPLGGQPMVRHTVAAVCNAALAQVVVVGGAQAEAVRSALTGLPVEFVVNPAWTEGMSTSLQAGLRALRPDIQAVFIVLADQPALTPDLLQTLVDRYRSTGAPVVVPFYRGQRGNPVLWDRSLFAELLTVAGDQGGRVLLGRYEAAMERVELDDPAITLDVDTPQDYQNLAESRKNHGC